MQPEKTTRDEIVDAWNRARDCEVAEWEISQKEVSIKQEKIKAHNDTLLAKRAIEDLKNK